MNFVIQMIAGFKNRSHFVITLHLFALAVLISVLSMQASAESERIGIEISYSVRFGDVEIGKSVRTVVNGNDGYAYAKHKVSVGPLLKLLGEDSYTQISGFRFVDGAVMPVAFEVTNESGKEIASAKFDWANQKILFGNGNNIDMPELTVLDWESWYVSLILTPTERLQNQRATIVEQNRIKTYEYQSAIPRQTQFKGDTVDTVTIKMQDVNDGRRSYVVWIYPQLNNIPVRIDKIKKNQQISFVATSFDWVYSE